MEIYLDVVLFQNFIINLFLLFITFKLMKIKTNKKKVMLASFIGTIYTLTMIFPRLVLFSRVPFQLVVAFIMIKIVLGRCNIKSIFKGTGTFIICSILLAGLCF